jgi:hypothetical protein
MSILSSEGRSANNGLSMHAYRYISYYLVRVPTYEKGLVSITLRRNRKNEVPYSRIWVATCTILFYRSGKQPLWEKWDPDVFTFHNASSSGHDRRAS